MNFVPTEIIDLYLIELKPKGDDRGWLMRTFSEDIFKANIPDFNSRWIQMNHSFNKEKFTWRGFHYQKPPHQETKVVRCISGAVVDYVIDLRKRSNTFLNVFKAELSAENKKMIFIPKGFAHGFLTLAENTELVYLHDEFYTPESESGIRFDDPLISLSLQYNPVNVSERDRTHPLLTDKFEGY